MTIEQGRARRPVTGTFMRAASLADAAATTDGVTLADELEGTTVAHVMDPLAPTLSAEATARHGADALIDQATGGAPVVDSAGSLIGFVAVLDLLRSALAVGAPEPTVGRRVRDVMTPFAYALPVGATLAVALELMQVEGLSRVPIIDGRRRVVGVLSARDLVGWLTERTDVARRRARIAAERGRAQGA